MVSAGLNGLRTDRLPLSIPAGFYTIDSSARPLLLSGAQRLFNEGAVFLDAREVEAYESGRVEGALSLPLDDWAETYPEIEPWIEGERIVVYAGEDEIGQADGLASVLASRGHGKALYLYLGGFPEWSEAGLPVETGEERGR